MTDPKTQPAPSGGRPIPEKLKELRDQVRKAYFDATEMYGLSPQLPDDAFEIGYRMAFDQQAARITDLHGKLERARVALDDLIDDHHEGCDCWHHLALKEIGGE